MWETVKVFFTYNAVVISSIGGALGIIEFFFSPFRMIRAKFKKPEKVEITNPEVLSQAMGAPSAPTEPVLTMTLAQYEQKLDIRETQVRAKLETAHANERTVLQAQLDDLIRQKASPENALIEANDRIADLEMRLTREGNTIGGDKLDAARAALKTGDFSAADDLFAEIEAREAIAVQSAARAAFARGEIAEAEVRWADAAAHYARAAGLQPDFETLCKAQEFAGRAGNYPAALQFGKDALKLARQGGMRVIWGEFSMTMP